MKQEKTTVVTITEFTPGLFGYEIRGHLVDDPATLAAALRFAMKALVERGSP